VYARPYLPEDHDLTAHEEALIGLAAIATSYEKLLGAQAAKMVEREYRRPHGGLWIPHSNSYF
jgi:hypothetical protein